MRLTAATRDYLAGVYVLGCTSARVRRRIEALARRDPLLRAAQDRWAQRLAGLAGGVPPVQPQPQTIKAILARLAPQDGAGGLRPWRGLRQGLAAAILGAALALGGYFYSSGVRPVLTAQVADAQGQPNWDFAAPADGHALTVRVRRPGLVPPDHSLEIWALSAQGKAVSLGLVPAARDQVLALNAVQREALRGAQQIAITREPVGGSPTGQATGPILHMAALTRRG